MVDRRQPQCQRCSVVLALLCGGRALVNKRRHRLLACLRSAQGKSKAKNIEAVINIGRDAEKKRMFGRMNQQERVKLRQQEIQRKIDLLRGNRIERYRKNREKGKASQIADAGDEEGVKEAQTFAKDRVNASKDTRADGGVEAFWSFDRDGPKGGSKKASGDARLSEEANRIASVELDGRGGAASARSVMDAAVEFRQCNDRGKAVLLLEVARERIDREQIERKIDCSTAQELDEECMWMLADTYREMSRLTLACESYREIKDRALVEKTRRKAEVEWAKAAFKVAEELFKLRRFGESLDVIDNIRDTADTSIQGVGFMEELELQAAMTLQEMGRTAAAKKMLAEFIKKSCSRKRKTQARFILDVINVDASGFRNTEFHEIFEQNFELPKDSIAGVRTRVSATPRRVYSPNLSEREREFRTWASKYWEERMKSPVYYTFLTLWVTWPFAIPVVSLMKKANVAWPLV